MEKSKAVVVKKFGGYSGISVEEFPLPSLHENLIEVKVKYGGLNFADIYKRQGLMATQKPPFVLGMECVGTVTAVGSSNTSLQVGQRVICYNVKGGMYQETIRVPSDNCYLLPEFVSWEDGAAISVQYLTAYFAVLLLGALRSGDSILILSCGGGVGWAATQIAKTVENVKIYGSVSKGKEEFVKENGVDVVFNNEDLQYQLESSGGFDVIIANQAGEFLDILQNALKPLGRLIILGASNLIKNETLSYVNLIKFWWNTKKINPLDLIMKNRVVAGLNLATLIETDADKIKEVFAKIFELLKDGKIKPKIHSVWPIEKFVDATKELAERRNVGKVLISM